LSPNLNRDAIISLRKEQWHLKNAGAYTGQESGEDVKASGAWKITQGKSTIVIAILDDGVDIEHPHLKANILKKPDPEEPRDLYGRDFYIADDEHPEHFNPRPKLFQYPYTEMTGNDIHGTPCAGVIAATHTTDKIRGIAPKCKILPVT
jgi:subtilisin family serine protease